MRSARDLKITETRDETSYRQGVEDAKAAAMQRCPGSRFLIAEAIDAACLAPPEPEIVVTQEMVEAGAEYFMNFKDYEDPSIDQTIKSIYRAMRALEPKE